MKVQHLALAAVVALLVGCGSRDVPRPASVRHAIDKNHDVYRARLFTAQLRGAARIPLHVDGPDGTSVDMRADDDGRFCLVVPAISTEAGMVSPRITVDWSHPSQSRPAETTRFARDEVTRRLGPAPGFAVSPQENPGATRDRQPSLGVPQSEDWRVAQDDAAQCHQVESGRDEVFANPVFRYSRPVTEQAFGRHDVALLMTARALDRSAADRVDACYRKTHDYGRCSALVHPRTRDLPGGFVNGPQMQIRGSGYAITTTSNAGTYVVSRHDRGGRRADYCHAIRVTTCPPGLAP